ncbi:MAG TPA: hypothetical protein VJT54_06270 [Verrucomicrobiae bacterium]|nr:hypothetical protein [Verrucomicrobiae bacterium]
MTTQQTFSPVRLLFGLIGVSIISSAIVLLPKPWIALLPNSWAAHWIWEYIYVLVLPTVGYGCVFYWSRISANLDALQRAVVGSLLGFVLALGFTIAVLDCLVPVISPVIYPTFYESALQSGTFPVQDVQDVRWGYHGNRLLFVVFQTSVNGKSHTEFEIAPTPDPMKTGVIIPHYDHWIELPDGTRKELPGSRTMFEYDLGGAFTSRSIDVTLDEFRQWTASRPEIYSVEKLEQFVARQRKHI